MRLSIHPQSAMAQLLDLTKLQLSNWRWSWKPMLITGVLSPILTIILLGTVGRDADVSAKQYVLTGAIVMALLFENQNKVAANFSFMREEGTLDYFRTVPVRLILLAPATLAAFFVMSLPAIAVTIAFGQWFLDLPIHPSLWLAVVIPLSAVSLAGIGATIGVLAPSQEASGSISMFAALVLIFLGPVMIAPESLPEVLRNIGLVSPSAHAASALRQSLFGPVQVSALLQSVAFLAVVAVITLAIAHFAMKRRD